MFCFWWHSTVDAVRLQQNPTSNQSLSGATRISLANALVDTMIPLFDPSTGQTPGKYYFVHLCYIMLT